ncbi:hypothetical protein KKF61_08365 [Patescibacteria group bacterium]|nr:hypothetical protein [Patescibacteria group bacterium]
MNDIIKENRQPSAPGIGVAGLVMCPFFKGACLKGGCELWVELKQNDIFIARCSLAWMTILATETRQSIDKITNFKEKSELT